MSTKKKLPTPKTAYGNKASKTKSASGGGKDRNEAGMEEDLANGKGKTTGSRGTGS